MLEIFLCIFFHYLQAFATVSTVKPYFEIKLLFETWKKKTTQEKLEMALISNTYTL